MSEAAVADQEEDRVVPAVRGPIWIGFFAIFWGWLLLRWINNWFLPDSIALAPDQPFISPAPIEVGAATLRDLATSLGPLGLPVRWLAGGVAFAATAIESLPLLVDGAWLTIVLTFTSIAFGFVIAVPLSVARVYGSRSVRWVSLSFTELIRGTPLLAQLFFLYFGLGLTSFIRELPAVGVGYVPDQAVWVAIIGFTINSSAYQAEYLRSALVSVESGQLTAARSIGLSKVDGIRYVVLPQALRYAIPGWSNELIYLIKYSSLAAFITVRELYFQTELIANDTYQFTELFVLAALVYLALVLSASAVTDFIEETTAIPGLGQRSR
jgi:polar amino acid transport system permease protein